MRLQMALDRARLTLDVPPSGRAAVPREFRATSSKSGHRRLSIFRDPPFPQSASPDG